MTREKSHPTLLDIARYAGVSPTTVSRVINGTNSVNETTRARVLSSIAALGYKPALSLAYGKNATQGSIALIITDILNPFFPELVRGVEDETGTSGLSLILYDTAEDPQRERQVLDVLAEKQVDGIIACASRIATQDLVALHERHNTPMVVINRRIDHPDIPCITIDFTDAACRAAQHLLRLNHTRIGYLCGRAMSESSLARRRGIEAALAGVGLRLSPEWCPPSFPGVEGGFQAMSNLLTAPVEQRPTAVIAYNDIMAIGALHAIRAYGLRVPDDISVVGFDGVTMAAYSNPPLTTIDQPKYRMGRLAMQMLRQIMQGQSVPGRGYTLMESPLVVRESTSPLPAAEL